MFACSALCTIIESEMVVLIGPRTLPSDEAVPWSVSPFKWQLSVTHILRWGRKKGRRRWESHHWRWSLFARQLRAFHQISELWEFFWKGYVHL